MLQWPPREGPEGPWREGWFCGGFHLLLVSCVHFPFFLLDLSYMAAADDTEGHLLHLTHSGQPILYSMEIFSFLCLMMNAPP